MQKQFQCGNACLDGRYSHIFPWPCKMLFDIYDDHLALQSFYMSQIGDYQFHQTLCFVDFGFGIFVSLINDLTMIINMNAYFSGIHHLQSHISSCHEYIFFVWSRKIVRGI